MKIRKFFNKVKKTLFSFTLCFIGAFISWNFLQVPLNDYQFELCERVADEMSKKIPNPIYSGDIYIHVTEDFSVHVDMSGSHKLFSVASTFPLNRGKVVVTELKDGKLLKERKMETGSAVFLSILVGLLCYIIYKLIIDTIKKRIKKS